MEHNYLTKNINNKMFDNKEQIHHQNINKPSIFPDINFNNEFIEPKYVPFDKNNLKILKPDWTPDFVEKPDLTPDFSEKIDVIGDSINLALYTLNMSRSEYNSSDITSLKNQRQFFCSFEQILALNILIHYKKNLNLNFPNISPIKHHLNNSIPLDEF